MGHFILTAVGVLTNCHQGLTVKLLVGTPTTEGNALDGMLERWMIGWNDGKMKNGWLIIGSFYLVRSWCPHQLPPKVEGKVVGGDTNNGRGESETGDRMEGCAEGMPMAE